MSPTHPRTPAPPHPLLVPLEPYRDRPVLLALSGGGDSVGLLRALLEAGAQIHAAHLDHALRPESTQDAEWVAALCVELGVPLEHRRVDVAKVAASRGWNLEAAARTLRYSFLARAAKAHGAGVTLTAHTREDHAETVLLQLLRGTSKATGIPAKRGPLERPWLGISRADIRAYLQRLNQSWLEDASNLEVRFTRNWLRLEVAPLLRARFPAFEPALARYAAHAQEDEALLEDLRARVTPYSDWRREPSAVQRRLIAHALERAGFALDGDALERVRTALSSPKVEHLTLARKRQGVGSGDWGVGRAAVGLQGAADGLQEGESGPPPFTTHDPPPATHEVTVQGGKLWLEPPAFGPPNFAYPPSWTLRHRLPGDTLRLSSGTRKLSDVLTDLKVPRAWRERVWLLAEGHEVRWLGLSPPLWAQGYGANVTPWWDAMGAALELAREGALSGEVPVGALVLRGSEVVGRGRNRSRERGDPTQHAELEALREAARLTGGLLTGCTLTVTLEPCPMCLGAALEARVSRIVFGADNPKLGALGGVQDLLRAHWGFEIEVVKGIRSSEAAALLEGFFAGVREGKGG